MVEVSLSYAGNSLTFPINPEVLKDVINSSSLTESVEALGEISIPQLPALSTITFQSFFSSKYKVKEEFANVGQGKIISPITYVKWIKNWQASRQPAKFVVSELNWNKTVTCESFSYWVNAGEENEIYFDISLKEYREYGAKRTTLAEYNIDDAYYRQVLGNADDTSQNPVTFSATRRIREKTEKDSVPNYVYMDDNDSIVTVAKKYGGGTKAMPDLYENNKSTLAETLGVTIGEMKAGTDVVEKTAVTTADMTELNNDNNAFWEWLKSIW